MQDIRRKWESDLILKNNVMIINNIPIKYVVRQR